MKKMTFKTLALSAIATLALTGCMDKDAKSSSDDGLSSIELPSNLRGDGEVIATIDGVNIYKSEFDAYISARTGESYASIDPTSRQRIFNEFKQLELLSREARKRGLGDANDIALKKRNMHKNLLTQALMKAEDDANPITDELLQAKYEAELPKLTPEMYRARHILVDTESDAQKIIAQLDKGADFATLAKEKSTGPSGANGGDLDWFTADRMVAPFSAATAALEVGKYTKTPVKTRFGYHVILKEDQKKEEAPPLEAMKPRLTNQIRQERVKSFLDNLEGKAKVEKLFEKKTEEAKELVKEMKDKVEEATQ